MADHGAGRGHHTGVPEPGESTGTGDVRSDAMTDPAPRAGSAAETADAESRQRSARAVLRDLNRNLTDLLGPCRSTADGAWVVLRPGASGTWVAGLPDLSVAEVGENGGEAQGLGGQDRAPAPSHPVQSSPVHAFDTYFDIGVVGSASRVHVEVPR